MEVSTAQPFCTASTEAPLPRWQVMTFNSSSGRPTISAALCET